MFLVVGLFATAGSAAGAVDAPFQHAHKKWAVGKGTATKADFAELQMCSDANCSRCDVAQSWHSGRCQHAAPTLSGYINVTLCEGKLCDPEFPEPSQPPSVILAPFLLENCTNPGGGGNSYIQMLDECLPREDGMFMVYRHKQCKANCTQCFAMAGGADCGTANDIATDFSHAIPGCEVCTYGLRDFGGCPCGACFDDIKETCARNLCEDLVPKQCMTCVRTSNSSVSCRACLQNVVFPPQYQGHCAYLAKEQPKYGPAFCNPDVSCNFGSLAV